MSASTTPEQQIEEVKRWLLNKKRSTTNIDLDADLIEHRVLDSLDFVSFIIFLEGLTGREIHPSVFKPSTFRTLRSIRDNLLAKLATT
jgi:acyl carrier protein